MTTLAFLEGQRREGLRLLREVSVLGNERERECGL